MALYDYTCARCGGTSRRSVLQRDKPQRCLPCNRRTKMRRRLVKLTRRRAP